MLGIMGNIDEQVNDRADSMQMQGKTSTVSKDLLDVMATQKIAREKDAALKELQMAQQQNPNTIKDQLEQKVMGMTQNEMTNQTAGIMAQRQPQGQQRRPQQGGIAGARPPMPMGGAPKPPMGGAPKPPMPMAGARPPMGGGIAGAAPRPMMASGGIVGYLSGGLVDMVKQMAAKEGGKLSYNTMRQLIALHGDEMREHLTDGYGYPKKYFSSDEFKDFRKQQDKRRQQKEDVSQRYKDDMAAITKGTYDAPNDAQKQLGGQMGQLLLDRQTGADIKKDEPFFPTPTGEKPDLPPQTPKTPKTDAAGIASTLTPPVGGSGIQLPEEINPRGITDSATAGENIISDRMGERNIQTIQGLASVDPMAKRDEETKRLDELYGKTELKNMLTEAQSGIAAAQKEYDSPEMRRRRNLEAFRRAGASGLGQLQQSRDELSLRRARQKRDDLIQNSDLIFKRAEKIDAGSSKMLSDMMTQQREALGSIERIANNDQVAKQNMMQLKGDLEGKVQDQLIKMMGIKTQSELQAQIANSQTISALNATWAKYMNNVQTLAAEKLTELMPQAQEIIAKGDKATDEELRQLKTAEEMIQGIIYAETAAINSMFARQMAALNPQLAKLDLIGSIATMGGTPNIGNLQQPPSGIGAFANKQDASDFSKYQSAQ